MRLWALEHKNCLFAGWLCSGQLVAAHIMTLIQSAKMNALDSHAYLIKPCIKKTAES